MAKSAVIGSLRVALGLDSAQFQAGLNNSKKNMESFAARVKVGLAAVAAGVAAAGAAMTATVTRMASAAAQTGDVADRLGVAVTSLQELRHAAEMSGVGVQNFDVAFRRFIRRSAEAARGTGAAKDAFTELGVSLTDTEGRMRKSEDIFNDVADAMSKVKDPANRLRLAFKMFDTDGAAMTKMLANGSEGIKQLREQAQQLGIVMDAKTVAAASRFNDTLTLLGKSAEGFRTRLFAGVIPAFERMASQLFALSSNTQVLDGVIAAITATMNGLARALSFVLDNFTYVVQAGKLFVGVQVASIAIGMGRALVGLAYSLRSVGLVMTAVHSISRLKLKTWLLIAGAIGIATGQFEKLEHALGRIWESVQGFLPDAVMGSLLDDLSAGIPEAEAMLNGLGDSAVSAFGKAGSAAQEAAKKIGAADPWEGLRDQVAATSHAFDMLRSVGQTVASSLSNLIGGLIEGTTTLAQGIADLTKQLGSMLLNQGLQMLVSALTGGIGGAGGGLGSILGGMFGGFRPSAGGFMNMLGMPGYANGTGFHPGGLAVVGERGREIVNLPRGSQVIPNHALRLGGGGAPAFSPNVTINGSGLTEEQMSRAISGAIGQSFDHYRRVIFHRDWEAHAADRMAIG